jgi:ABC-type bacteriocin/lantibiotic exporter with double-glycine peptidase domain
MIKIFKKFYSILDIQQKNKLFLLIFLSLIAAVLEMLGLGLLVPIIASLSNPDLPTVSWINKNLDKILFNFAQSNDNKVFFLLILFGTFFLLKTLFFTYFTRINSKFSSNLYSDLSGKIFNNYLHQDYSFYILRSSSQLIQNATNEVDNLVNVFFVSFMIFINEILLLFAIGSILIFISPISFSFLIVLFSIFSFIFIFFIKRLLKKLGHQRQDHQISSIRYIQDGIRNIKDLKIYGIENKFYNYFFYEAKKYSEIEQNVNFLSTIPKYFIEFIGILVFICAFQLFAFLEFSSDDVIIIIGILAASALKILPSINRIMNSIIKIKYSLPSVNTIFKEIKITKKAGISHKSQSILIKNSIVLKNLSFKYHNSSNYLFDKININIPTEKIIGIVGESGSGKTTLLDLILGLLKPTKGKIFFNDIDIFKNIRSWQNNIGYVQQFSYFIQDSIKNNIILGSKSDHINYGRINECLKIVGLKNIIKKLPRNIDTHINELGNNFSGGQKQRLSIARALYINPKILILDEATNSLDDNSEDIIIKNIIASHKNRSIIIVTHKKKLTKYCDIVFQINSGSIKVN